MGNKKTRISMKNQIIFALRGIKDKYPKVMPSDIEMFAPIYYPIAILEMDIDEMTFEDFESVQLTVLRLISLGQTDHEIIAELLGLSPNYVFRIKHLLRGYGHIDDKGEITELGSRSLQQEKKIIKSRVWQKFQVDALNGILIKMSKSVSESMLINKDDTRIVVGHLDYLDGISTQSIKEQLQNHNYSDFIRQKSGILNTNAVNINDVRCVEVKYAQCFLLKYKDFNEPIVFVNIYDESKKEIRERFSWRPFSVYSEDLKVKYNFESDIPISSDLARQYIRNVYYMILERANGVDMEKELLNALEKVYPFEHRGISIGGYSTNNFPIVYINEEALRKYTSWLPYFMMELGQYGEYLITNEYLYGKMISLRTSSERLLEVCRLLNHKVESNGRSKVFSELKDKLKDIEENKLLIDTMENVL